MDIFEYRFTKHRVAEVTGSVRGPADIAAAVARMMLEGSESESLLVLALDTANSIIGIERVVMGSVSSAHVRMAEVFRFAVRVNATSIVLVHNHPSGNLTPSPSDLHLTSEVLAAGKLLDIDLLDHVIIGEGSAYTSLRDHGVAFSR